MAGKQAFDCLDGRARSARKNGQAAIFRLRLFPRGIDPVERIFERNGTPLIP